MTAILGSDSDRAFQNEALRFKFGENWRRFLRLLDGDRIAGAEDSLRRMLKVETLEGLSFLDAGSGSGLFSLAARRLGARVHSFDYDPQSVACTEELRRRYFSDDPAWTIEQGSVVDETYLNGLGRFDVVYSWGVVHHTGTMWTGLELLPSLVANGGKLFIAIYNDQGWISAYWTWVKRHYNMDALWRAGLTLFHMPYLFCLRWLVRHLRGKAKLERGMALWSDMVDWLGGYPFEVASPRTLADFYAKRGFTVLTSTTCGCRHGCNEFVLVKC